MNNPKCGADTGLNSGAVLPSTVHEHLPELTEEFELQVTLELILGIFWNGELATNERVIKWKSLCDNEATWEPIHLMNQQFPSF